MSNETKSTGVRRRDFLKVLGATGAATTMVGCATDEVERLVPYLVSPDNTVPGVSNYYATTCRECGAGCGVIAETRDGRVTKLEGNPQHPLNRGAICARGQASLQGLYNPDRYRGPMLKDGAGKLQPATWEQALEFVTRAVGQARSGGAAGRAVFINQYETGSFPAFLDSWLAAHGMPPHLSYDAELDQAVLGANGGVWPRYDFSSARLVVSFSADFLDGWGLSVPQQLDWADARAKLGGGPRMVYVGPRRSLTGLNADEWIACRPGGELAIANALRGQGSLEQAAQASGASLQALQRLQRDIAAIRPAMFLSGSTASNAGDLAAAVNGLNGASGAAGVAVRQGEGSAQVASLAEMRGLVARMNAGQVSVLFVRGANPAHTLPKVLGFAEAMAKVPVKISFSSYPDATSEMCDVVLPDHHGLESWGDAAAPGGQMGLQQPVMEPVFDTRQTADVLIQLASVDPAVATRYPQRTYREWITSRIPGGAQALGAALAKGLAPGAPAASSGGRVPVAPVPAPAIETTAGDFYLVVYQSSTLGDGRGANKPWLQELPDPVSKICWQSWVEIHPKVARRMGIAEGDHVTIRTAAGSITAPVWPYIGVREDTVAIATGRGHTAYGRFAQGVGVNPYDLLPVAEDPRTGALALSSTKASVAKAGGNSDLVTTEGSARQHGRGIGQALTLLPVSNPVAAAPVVTGAQAPPAAAGAHGALPEGMQQAGGLSISHHAFPGDASHEFLPGLRAPIANDAQGELGDPNSNNKGMYDPEHWSGMAKRRWAMTIDLARCTGCSACVTACYAENNIPTVGAPYQGRANIAGIGYDERPGANIIKGREMSWIRLERYFEGGEDGSSDFDTRFVPMMCQHCGNAPCEPVCPVYATYHAPDGLNVQVYNRCVGTRYCSNNCPYKVRYFNWFGYGEPRRRHYAWPEPLNWQLNPDVTVRGKGVMEKCTFCVQRIREAENRAALEHRPLQADEFTTACAQACPSRAIVFGDADPSSGWTVAGMVNDPRAYHVFPELNTYTAVVYLKKVNHLGEGQKDPSPPPASAHGGGH
jgi:Fe-S-cluster-containing dehydrogenase component